MASSQVVAESDSASKQKRSTTLYPPPNGPELTPDECRALDDTYFSSDPTSYFRSKVDTLLDWIDQPVPSTAAPSDYRRRMRGH